MKFTIDNHSGALASVSTIANVDIVINNFMVGESDRRFNVWRDERGLNLYDITDRTQIYFPPYATEAMIIHK